MKINPKHLRLALLAVFVVLFAIGLSAYNKAHAAEHEAVVGLGIGIIHLDDSFKSQVIGYRYNRAWGVEIARTGEDIVDDVKLDPNWRFSAVRYVHWREGKVIEPWLRFGFSVWDEPPAAVVDDDLCFDLALGVEINRVVQLGWHHCSTAGRTDPNSGQDELQLRFNMRF